MKYLLFNSLSDNGSGEKNALKAKNTDDSYIMKDVTGLEDCDMEKLLSDGIEIVLAGGDGTLNRFINRLGNKVPEKNIYYYPTGSGNDFMNDIADREKTLPVRLNRYIENLPVAEVNGKVYRFINGIGYGIDGYCCEEADKIKRKTKKPINYTRIALKGLLYAYRPVTAEVTVDGVKSRYANVWLVPTMNGRYYGGGMMIAPVQDRLNREGTVTTVVVSCKSRIRTLITFPMIFSGAHKDRKDIVKMFSGSEIHVSFDRPTALQVDGETVRNVTEYTVLSAEAYRRKVISGEKIEKSGDTLSV